MRTLLCASLLSCMVPGVMTPAWAGEQEAHVKAILDKAIQALGGAERLAKHKASTWKAKGVFLGGPQPVRFTGQWWAQPPDQAKSVIEFTVNGMKNVRVQVLNGARGWLVDMGASRELNPEELHAAKEGLHANRVGRLITLHDPAFELTPLGEMKVDDRPAVGIKVAHQGYADLSLYFDKETGLLVRAQRRFKDPASGQEFDEDNYYSDYKDYGGIKHFSKLRVTRNGKDFVALELTEYKPEEKLDESIFRQP